MDNDNSIRIIMMDFKTLEYSDYGFQELLTISRLGVVYTQDCRGREWNDGSIGAYREALDDWRHGEGLESGCYLCFRSNGIGAVSCSASRRWVAFLTAIRS